MVIIAIVAVASVPLILLAIPGLRYICNYFTWGNEYDEKYATEWVSDDGHIVFVVTSSSGIQGPGSYEGTYIDNEGTEYEIMVAVNGYADIRLDYSLDGRILFGVGKMNYFADTFTVVVERAEWEKSIYNVGDEVVFRKQ